MRRKADIESAGLSGLPIAFEEVARVSRTKRVVTLRHSWAEDVDGRIWAAVRGAYAKGAQTLANNTGRSVEIYDIHGNVIAAYEPERGAS